MDDDESVECGQCGDEHPVGVMEDGLCPRCLDGHFGDVSSALREFVISGRTPSLPA